MKIFTKKLGIFAATVYHELVKSGEKERKPTKNDEKIEKRNIKIRNLYKRGLPGYLISKKLGVSTSTVYHELIKSGRRKEK